MRAFWGLVRMVSAGLLKSIGSAAIEAWIWGEMVRVRVEMRCRHCGHREDAVRMGSVHGNRVTMTTEKSGT